MLYPVLHRLERLGYIQARWGTSDSGRRRRYCRLTKQGRAWLAQHWRQWQVVDAALRGTGAATPETPRRKLRLTPILQRR